MEQQQRYGGPGPGGPGEDYRGYGGGGGGPGDWYPHQGYHGQSRGPAYSAYPEQGPPAPFPDYEPHRHGPPAAPLGPRRSVEEEEEEDRRLRWQQEREREAAIQRSRQKRRGPDDEPQPLLEDAGRPLSRDAPPPPLAAPPAHMRRQQHPPQPQVPPRFQRQHLAEDPAHARPPPPDAWDEDGHASRPALSKKDDAGAGEQRPKDTRGKPRGDQPPKRTERFNHLNLPDPLIIII